MRHVRNEPSNWVRAVGAFEAIVDPSLFAAAGAIFAVRAKRFTDEEMLNGLRNALRVHGFLPGFVINEADALPSSGAYQSRFGSLLRAYQLVGFTPDRDYRYIEINKRLRKVHSDIILQTVSGIEDVGGQVQHNDKTDQLTINGEFSASMVISRCAQTGAGAFRWNIRLDTGLSPDVTIVVRMDQANKIPLDYYLLPTSDMTRPNLRLAESNGLSLDAYRFANLEHFFAMAERTQLLEVA
jgi:hypothetical protein